jgi:hypothetical protein
MVFCGHCALEDFMKITKILNRVIFTTALAGGLLFAVSTPVGATPNNDDACHQRLENDKARIDHDAARHGNDSSQVRHDVDRMNSDRQWCKDHHSDWDHSRFDVGIYFRP